LTKAASIWTEAYESARVVMPIERALERADAVLLYRMDIGLDFTETSGRLTVKVTLPGDRFVSRSCVGYMTPTIRVRLTKAILGLLTPAVLEAGAIPVDLND